MHTVMKYVNTKKPVHLACPTHTGFSLCTQFMTNGLLHNCIIADVVSMSRCSFDLRKRSYPQRSLQSLSCGDDGAC